MLTLSFKQLDRFFSITTRQTNILYYVGYFSTFTSIICLFKILVIFKEYLIPAKNQNFKTVLL